MEALVLSSGDRDEEIRWGATRAIKEIEMRKETEEKEAFYRKIEDL